MKRLKLLFSSLLLVGACASDGMEVDGGEDLDGDGKADGTSSFVSDANLNGLWDGKHGTKSIEDVVIRSWDTIGIELQVGNTVVPLTRSGKKLEGTGVALEIDPNEPGQRDDEITGTVDGKTIALHRDVELKPPISVELPRDRPYRMWMRDVLAPLAQQDRESYTRMDAAKIKEFMQSTVLFQAGSFQRKYMKGTTRAQQTANMLAMIDAMDGIETTPRSMISDPRFTSAVKARLKDTSLTGLALVNFNLYFSAAAGRAITIPLGDDTKAWFITDRPSRAEKLGLVVMDTPTHEPLASTFGRQLLDLGDAAPEDTATYAEAMMNLLVKSDPSTTSKLSPFGRSALVDWFAVMAIEDYRVVTFSDPELNWGYNITNVQFFGLVARALARAGSKDSAGNPVEGQVIVDDELRPGNPSYADVLNGGNDMQEFEDMARLKELATSFLRAKHAPLVAEVEAAFADVLPKADLPFEAKADIFHFITAQLYDPQGRMAVLVGARADRAVKAVTALVAALQRDSVAFEAFILANGVTKSNTPAPKATGF